MKAGKLRLLDHALTLGGFSAGFDTTLECGAGSESTRRCEENAQLAQARRRCKWYLAARSPLGTYIHYSKRTIMHHKIEGDVFLDADFALEESQARFEHTHEHMYIYICIII